jgi:hypothetical protein
MENFDATPPPSLSFLPDIARVLSLWQKLIASLALGTRIVLNEEQVVADEG